MVYFGGYLINTFRKTILAHRMGSQISHASAAPGGTIQGMIRTCRISRDYPLSLVPSTIPPQFLKVGASWIFAWALGA
jgi:hypothetical protein